jgi:mannobiose 2-epimerase
VGAELDRETRDTIQRLAVSARQELWDNIAPFWLKLSDPRGGHFCSVDSRGVIDKLGPKFLVFEARTAWTYAELARESGLSAYREHAQRAFEFLERFRDRSEAGGYFASLTHDGRPKDRWKHLYGQAFALLAIAAYARLTHNPSARSLALQQFATIEERVRSVRSGLYCESYDQCWRETPNLDRSFGEEVARHSADTHLHIIEAYTLLLQVTQKPAVATALRAEIETLLSHFVSDDGSYLHQKIDASGAPVAGPLWPGHDIEASWIIHAAADALGDARLELPLRTCARRLAQGAVAHGPGPAGGWAERVRNGTPDPWCLWWVQAEAALGTLYEGLRSNDPRMIAESVRVWGFIQSFVVDRAHGDWRLRVTLSGAPDLTCPLVVFWKDAIHQARACLEISRLCEVATGGSLSWSGATTTGRVQDRI